MHGDRVGDKWIFPRLWSAKSKVRKTKKGGKEDDLVEAGVASLVNIRENVFGTSLDHLVVAPVFPQRCAIVTGLSMCL